MNLYRIWAETLEFNSRLKRKEYFLFVIAMTIFGYVSEFVLIFGMTKLDSSFNALGFASIFGLIFIIPVIDTIHIVPNKSDYIKFLLRQYG